MINDSDTDIHSLFSWALTLLYDEWRYILHLIRCLRCTPQTVPQRTSGASDCWVASGDLINRRAGNKILIFHEIGEERPLRKYKIWFSKFKMFWVIFLYFSGGEKPWLEQFLWTIYNQRFSLSLLCSINPLERRVGRGRMRDERADGWSPFYKISGGSD